MKNLFLFTLLSFMFPFSIFACCNPILSKSNACEYKDGVIEWYWLEIYWPWNPRALSNGPVLKNNNFLYYPVYTNVTGENPYLYSWNCKTKKPKQIISQKLAGTIFNFFGTTEGWLDPVSIDKDGYIVLHEFGDRIKIDLKQGRIILIDVNWKIKTIKY